MNERVRKHRPVGAAGRAQGNPAGIRTWDHRRRARHAAIVQLSRHAASDGWRERGGARVDAARSGPYNVWLAFVERDTGNYVTGVKVAVVDSKENAVVDTVSDGPWLLAQVPPGQYKVRTSDGQEQAITAGAGTPAMTVLRLARQP
jgi:hypothetical protein